MHRISAPWWLPEGPWLREFLVTVHGVAVGFPGTQGWWANRILVDRSVGLGCSVIRWWDAVACLAAIVTVAIVHCTVRIIVWNREEGRGERKRKREHSGAKAVAQT